MAINYQLPAFTIGDQVGVKTKDPNNPNSPAPITIEGFIVGYKHVRNEKGEFVRWEYEVLPLTQTNKIDAPIAVAAEFLSPRSMITRQHTRRV